MEKFPIGAHLPLSNKPYDMISVRRELVKKNAKNDISFIRTRKPIRTLTNQEKQNIERAPLEFLKDRVKGPQSTINVKLGLKIKQVARKTVTSDGKSKNQGFLDRNLK